MKKILLSIFCCMLAVIGMQAETLTLAAGTDFTSTSDSFLNGAIEMSTAKNGASSNPAYNSSNKDLRLYYASGGNGCSVTFTTDGSIKITGVEITATSTSYTPSVKYSVDGATALNGTWSSSTMTINDIEALETITIQNANTSNKQLRIKKFVITYEEVVSNTPSLSVDPEVLDFRAAPGATTEAKTITVKAQNIEGSVSYVCDNAAFAVTDNGDNTYDVAFAAPATEGTTTGTLTFSANGVEDVEVALTGVSSNSVVDVLNREFTSVSGTGYLDWSGKEGASGAVYAGNSAGGNDAIQLRSNNNESGIVTTTSAGIVKSVTVTWNSNTGSARKLQVYGKNSAYTDATELYDSSSQGTKLGEIAMGETTLTIDGEYKFIGLRSASGAMYIDEIEIEWGTATQTIVAEPTFSLKEGGYEYGTVVTLTAEEGATIHYTINGGDILEATTTATVVLDNATIEIVAYASANGVDSETVTYTYTATLPINFSHTGAVPAGTEVTISTHEDAGLMVEVTAGGETTTYDGLESTYTFTVNEETSVYVLAGVNDITAEAEVTFTVLAPAVAGDYELVTDASTLAAGDKIVIVATDYDFALSTTQNKNNRGEAEVVKNTEKNTVTFGEDVQVIYLQEGAVEGSFAFYVPGGYLYAASNSSNYLKTQDELNENGSWAISIAEGVANIVAKGANTHNILQYNQTSTLFSCYEADKPQKDVAIYRMVRYEENITSNKCYAVAVGSEWEEPAGCWYAAKFINKNTDAYTWASKPSTDDTYNSYIFYLAAGNTPVMRAKAEDAGYTYTHVEFVQLPAEVVEPANIQELDLTDVTYKTTGELYYDDATSTTYDLLSGEWKDLATGIEGVEVAEGIAYANGVVSAEGAIEVYNVGGAVVARGNDNVDLNGLNGGVYIVRNGDNVRKVVR